MEKVLYRNESCYGSGVRDVIDIIHHEYHALGNTDIFEYCLNNYNLSEGLKENLRQDISWFESEFQRCGEYPSSLNDDIENLIRELSALTGKEIRYALWLAPENTVRELYDGTDGNIDAYETSEIILSDLGPDGILFAYQDNPNPPKKTNK